jgi:hypothetical protein
MVARSPRFFLALALFLLLAFSEAFFSVVGLVGSVEVRSGIRETAGDGEAWEDGAACLAGF